MKGELPLMKDDMKNIGKLLTTNGADKFLGELKEAEKIFLSGRRNRQYQLWGPLMFQAWLDHQTASK